VPDSLSTDGDDGLLSELLRRVRRAADLSQRELADALGVARSTVARAELGQRDLPTGVLVRAAGLAGLRVALLDSRGNEVPGMDQDTVRDRAGRHFPAHLDTRHGDDDWWHGDWYRSRSQPWYTFDRRRDRRDDRRSATGTPPDHQPPRAGDSPDERARMRAEEASVARQARWRQDLERQRRRAAESAQLGTDTAPDVTCDCPPACDDLLFAEGPLTPRQQAVPHVEDCPCLCDIA
jgi:transcriptional regulator with XRE-family HTH domain